MAPYSVGPVYRVLPVSSGSASLTEPLVGFHSPPRRTEHADFPHSALLPASQEGLWDAANWMCFQSGGHQHLLHIIQPLPPSPSCISSVSGLADYRAFLSDAPASRHCQRNYGTAGSLRSLRVTPVHRYSKPFRHLLAFLPFPGLAGYRSDLLLILSIWDEEAFSSCLTCPCHRAAPTTPPECHVASVSTRHAMLPSSVRRRLGFRI